MAENNIMNRLNKLEAYADLIKEEAATLRKDLNKTIPAPRKAIQKVAAGVVAKRNARLIKTKA